MINTLTEISVEKLNTIVILLYLSNAVLSFLEVILVYKLLTEIKKKSIEVTNI